VDDDASAAAAEDAEGHGDREAGQRAADDRRQVHEPEPELHQEDEGRHLDHRAQHQQALDDAFVEVGLLDRNEDVAPDGERLHEREGGQPDERRRQGEPRRASALEPDGEAEREEDEPLREQDDGLVLYEELARGATAPVRPTRTERVGVVSPGTPPARRRSADRPLQGADCSAHGGRNDPAVVP